MHPQSARLTFREMTPDDLDDMALLLGDPEVMTYYPRPKTRDEAVQWVDWNRALYRTHGYGLWVLCTADGGFVGDCGLTPFAESVRVHTALLEPLAKFLGQGAPQGIDYPFT